MYELEQAGLGEDEGICSNKRNETAISGVALSVVTCWARERYYEIEELAAAVGE